MSSAIPNIKQPTGVLVTRHAFWYPFVQWCWKSLLLPRFCLDLLVIVRPPDSGGFFLLLEKVSLKSDVEVSLLGTNISHQNSLLSRWFSFSPGGIWIRPLEGIHFFHQKKPLPDEDLTTNTQSHQDHLSKSWRFDGGEVFELESWNRGMYSAYWENGGTVGMVPFIINSIYTLY